MGAWGPVEDARRPLGKVLPLCSTPLTQLEDWKIRIAECCDNKRGKGNVWSNDGRIATKRNDRWVVVDKRNEVDVLPSLS